MAEEVKEQSLLDRVMAAGKFFDRTVLNLIGLPANFGFRDNVKVVSDKLAAQSEGTANKPKEKAEEAEKTSQKPDETTTQAPQTVKQMVPETPIPQDIQERVMRVERFLEFIPKAFSNEVSFKVEKVDGVFDEQSIGALNNTLDFIKTKADINNQFPETGYSSELGEIIKTKVSYGIDAEIYSLKASNLFSKDKVVEDRIANLEHVNKLLPSLIRDLDYLADHDALKAVKMKEVIASSQEVKDFTKTQKAVSVKIQTQGKTPEEVQQEQEEDQISKDIYAVESALQSAVKGIPGSLGKFNDIAGKFGFSGLINDVVGNFKLNDDEVGGEFGANSQEIFSQLVIGVKLLNGEKNPTGAYTEQTGKQLKSAILTNPLFEGMRKEYGISGADENDDGFKSYQKALMSSDPTEQQKKIVAKYEIDHKLIKLNALIDSMNRLEDDHLLDPNKKAETTNAANMGISFFRDKFKDANWFQGIVDFLRDSSFGQIIDALLSMFGINIGGLWGRDSQLDMKQSVEQIDKSFGKELDAIMEEDSSLSVKDAVTKLQEKFKDNTSGFIKGNAIKLLIGSDDKKYMEAAINDAFEKAKLADSPEAAKAAFSERLKEIGTDYKADNTATIAGKVFTGNGASHADKQEAGKDLLTNSPNIAAAVVGAKVKNDGVIDVSKKQNIALIYTPDTTKYEQDLKRYAPEMVEAIQQGLTSARDKLELSSTHKNYINSEGKFTQEFDMGTNRMLQELLLRAQVHDHLERNETITQADLDGFEHKITLKNMVFIESYMKDKKIDEADYQKISGNLRELANDFQSTDPKDQKAGESAEHSVLEQSLVPASLFDLKLEDIAPKQEVKADPIIDKDLPAAPPKIAEHVEEEGKPLKPVIPKDDECGKPEPIVKHYNHVAQSGEQPVSFKTLNKLTPEERAPFDEHFKPYHGSLEKLFDNKIPVKEGVSTYYMLEPEKYGIHNSGVDMIVAMRDGNRGTVDIRGINYARDNITPPSVDGRGGQRSLDSILAFISKPNGGSIRQGVVTGFTGMFVLAPNSPNNSRGAHAEMADKYFFGARSGQYRNPQIKATGPGTFETLRADRDANNLSNSTENKNTGGYYPFKHQVEGWKGPIDAYGRLGGNIWKNITDIFKDSSNASANNPSVEFEQNSSDTGTAANDENYNGDYSPHDLNKDGVYDPYGADNPRGAGGM